MRHKGVGLKVKMLGPRVMSALQVWLWLLLFIFQNEFRISYAAEPGYLDFDNLPETNFSCAGKVIGGYYADLETDCQMFHVCTIGQLEEPMDIKFLCLNGTVFDQETRVCERVDEVDCSKSEHFYSLNLELYGNTAPPLIKAEIDDDDDVENGSEDDYEDDNYEETSTTPKTTTTSTTTTTTTTTTTKRPTTTTTKTYYTTSKPTFYQTTIQDYHSLHEDENDGDEYDLIDDNLHVDEPNKTSNQMKEDSSKGVHTHYDDSQVQKPLPPPLGTKNNQFVNYVTQSNVNNNPKPTNTEDNSQIFSPEDFIYHHNKQDFNHKTPAISFQQQSYSNDGQNSHVTVTTHVGGGISKTSGTRKVNSPINKSYISSSTPKSYVDKSSNFNNYQSFNSPKRIPLIPPNTQSQVPTGHPGLSTPKRQKEPLYFSFPKPSLTPQGFKPIQSTQSQLSVKPTNQMSKPFQSYQSSERHEISLENEYEFDKLTPNYPFIHHDLSHHFDHKRSQESNKYEPNDTSTNFEKEKVTTPTPYYNTWATRNNNYTKSLPRVIVTASASVSDSNGKKLNFSVGNIVHDVKPLVPTNYDEYKESDVLLDPFFLDVPKLKKGRNKRSKTGKIKAAKRPKRQTIIKVYKYDVAAKSTEVIVPMTKPTTDIETSLPLLKTVTQPAPKKISNIEKLPNDNFNKSSSIETVSEPSHWIPPDYVDDNYEPLVYHEVSSEEELLNQSTESSEIKTTSAVSLEPFTTNKLKIPSGANINVDKHNIYSNKVELTTENNVAKTTLDFVKIETTTAGFSLSTTSNTVHHEIKKYNLSTVHIVNLNEKHLCSGKKYYKFYPDKTNCRTFHMCTPGKSSLQVLDMVFICDLDTYFNKNTSNCTFNKPNDCEI
ncbi:uncharacterized protein LOC143915429 [Arctopsyche grandis]|uniref:uncharacterized protein LOC143915429 n=1 Tax=Arctopsyche grandis TaxID=121162 RepID=UPI00406D9772